MTMIEMNHDEFVELIKTRKSPTHIPKPIYPSYPGASQVDLCIMPGLLFDRHGCRLGYGRGHYDQYLQEYEAVHKCRPYLLAITHTDQINDTCIPLEVHDIKMDMIITPDEQHTIIKIE